MTDLVVVGGGVTGLVAAYEARRLGADVLLLESERRSGGVVVTERLGGEWIVEGGPDSFLGRDDAIPTLAGELGLGQRIVRQAAHGAFVWTGAELVPLSEGEAAALLGIQAKPEDLAAGHLSFAAGMRELVDALEAAVGPALRLGAGVSGITPTRGAFRLSVTGGPVVTAPNVILAVPAWRAAQLVRGLAREVAAILDEIRYLPSVTVSLAYRAPQVGVPLAGTGFVTRGGGALRACTFSSSKFPNRAPAGHVLLRAFLAPGSEPAAALAHELMRPILKIAGAPLWSRTYEWPRGIPVYGADHEARMARVRERLAGLGNLALAGAGYDGAGVGACVRSGREAVRSSFLASATTRSTVSPSS
ncbi:MAG TPA: FAD-dependent oxidoreductase [Gemmatimonadales bacterium]|nr:FAD-dependent oxidoreductase [Gemmatimonadales bacterium]